MQVFLIQKTFCMLGKFVLVITTEKKQKPNFSFPFNPKLEIFIGK